MQGRSCDRFLPMPDASLCGLAQAAAGGSFVEFKRCQHFPAKPCFRRNVAFGGADIVERAALAPKPKS